MSTRSALQPVTRPRRGRVSRARAAGPTATGRTATASGRTSPSPAATATAGARRARAAPAASARPRRSAASSGAGAAPSSSWPSSACSPWPPAASSSPRPSCRPRPTSTRRASSAPATCRPTSRAPRPRRSPSSRATTPGRVNVAYKDLSPHIINAVVAVEDRDFFEHDGVAPLGIARALFRDLKGDAVQQGGSTITQQYVKKAYLQTSERTLTRKFKEAVLSIKLEQRMSKEEILEGYLNTIYFGRWAYGIQAASRAYFGMDVKDLGVGQAAYLAGLIRAPEAADYSLHPEEAARRRHTALIAMEEEGYISHDEATFVDNSSFESMQICSPGRRRASNTDDAQPGGRGRRLRHRLRRRAVEEAAVQVQRGRDLRQGPAGLHDDRPPHAGAGLPGGLRRAQPAGRPGRRPHCRRRPGQHPGHGRRQQLQGQSLQLRRLRPGGRVRPSSPSPSPRR